MTPPGNMPKILVSGPESVLGRLQLITAGKARTIPIHRAMTLRDTQLSDILHGVDGIILAEEEISPEFESLARRIEAEGCPCLLATANDNNAHLIVGFGSHGLVRLSQSDSELADTISRFLRSLSDSDSPSAEPASNSPGDSEDAIWVRSGQAERRVPCRDIRSISADRDYAVIELSSASLLVRSTMTALEKQLDPRQFVRIHRSHIVAADRIEELRTIGPNKHEVRLTGDRRFPVGRSYWPKLKQRILGIQPKRRRTVR